MSDPFRSELDAAHRRIEKLETEHAARVSELEKENARLRERVIGLEPAPSRTGTGRAFAAFSMIILGVSLAFGMIFARIARAPSIGPATLETTLELPEGDPVPAAVSGDFDLKQTAYALGHVHIEDCVSPGDAHAAGHAKITIAASGVVTTARIDEGPYRNTGVGRCIEERFLGARVPPFMGAPRVVGKAFVIP
jgi:hypothetical protein